MASDDTDPPDGGELPEVSAWHRFTLRLSGLMLRPAPASGDDRPKKPTGIDDLTTVDEVEEAIRKANDKERFIGLLAAPIAALVALLVTADKIASDPKTLLANGQVNHQHVSSSVYSELGLVTLGLAIVMLAMAWFGKRLYLGIVMALFGLSIFNLGFWGFGSPFILAGAWYLVRAYRLQQKLKLFKGEEGSPLGPTASPARPSKRYTPPTAPPRRTPKPKPGKELEAG